MSSRKRPLAEISQPHSTPARYAPSTPHALRAIQQRNSAKKRSARSVRHVNNTINPGNTVRPDGSARNILRQFARITAPLTKKRISTPIHTSNDNKENNNPQEFDDDDSVLLKRPIFSVEENIDEDDSELPTAPTPSVLPDDEDEQPTVTFQNLALLRDGRPMSERIDRRKSRTSFAGGIDRDLQDDRETIHDGDATMMTERGRRAVSEEATGRLSRYSFGSIRMSDFGSELEFHRQSGQLQKTPRTTSKSFINYSDQLIELGAETGNLQSPQGSPIENFGDESVHIPNFGDDSFQLPMPEDEEEPVMQADHAEAQHSTRKPPELGLFLSSPLHGPNKDTEDILITPEEATSRRHTLLEMATAATQTTRRKRVKLNRHGNVVPNLPTSLIKHITIETQMKLGRRKPKLGRDYVKALEQATEWFFEQVGEDLAAYSGHGGRSRRVDSDDVLLLMKRQKVLLGVGELRKFAKEWLPRDVFKGLDLPEKL